MVDTVTLFASRPGQLVKINRPSDSAPQLMRISVEGMNLGPALQIPKKILVTSLTLVESGNMQILHTLDDSIYAYVFGDRIGSVKVGGLCFHDSECENDPNGNSSGGNGFSDIIQMYRENRAAIKRTPIKIIVANQIYSAFLTGLQLTADDPAKNIGQWVYDFLTLPPRTQRT